MTGLQDIVTVHEKEGKVHTSRNGFFKNPKKHAGEKRVLFFIKSNELDSKRKILTCEQVILINRQGLIGKI